MKRRNFVRLGGSVVGLGIVGATPALGASHNPPKYPPGATNDRGNWLNGQAEDIEVESVTAETANWDGLDFTFYTVRFKEKVAVGTWVYREPARLGGGNHVDDFGGDELDSFWYGVTGPYGEEIVHEGQVFQYFDTDDGWMQLTAKFANGELKDVNGVEPQ